MKKLIGITEFAKLIGIKVATARLYVRQGFLIPELRNEKLWSFFTLKQVEEWLEKKAERLKNRELKKKEKEFKMPKTYKLSDLAFETGIPYRWLYYLKISAKIVLPLTDEQKEQLKKEWNERIKKQQQKLNDELVDQNINLEDK